MDRAVVDQLRAQFPALARQVNGRPVVYLDGPAGTQVPERVASAVGRYLLHSNANTGGRFATSLETDDLMVRARKALADFFQAPDADCFVFGPNMTTLTFAISRALARTWHEGDEVLVTQLDHDANVTPWRLAAQEVGATVREVPLLPHDSTLDMDAFARLLSERTRLVAVGCASNASGSVNPVGEICRMAREVGAMVYLDGVHWAPHARLSVARWQPDFLVVSAYKFFGPHQGILWGRREWLERITPYKLRPAPERVPDRWMTGTQAFELVAGTLEAIEYLADVGRMVAPAAPATRREALDHAMNWIRDYEQRTVARLIDRLRQLDSYTVRGITDAARSEARLPTVAVTHQRLTSRQLAERLAELGIFTWHGNYYAYSWSHALGLEPGGALRIGLVHYNTPEEVDRLLDALAAVDDSAAE